MSLPLQPEEIRSLIGVQATFKGTRCEVVEFLEDEMALVLRCVSHEETSIQPNIYGDPTRRVPKTRVIQILSEDGSELHPEFIALELFVAT